MKQHFPRGLLAVSGILLLVIGSAVLFNPESIAAANGIALPDSPSFLSEHRAPGALLFASAIVILLGAVQTRFLRTGLALAALVYGSYALGRIVAISMDGMPSAPLTQALGIELILGIACLIALFERTRSHNGAGQG